MTLDRTDAVAQLDASRDDPNLFSARLFAKGPYELIVAITGDVPFVRIRFERDGAGQVTHMHWLSPELPHSFARQAGQ